MTVIYTIGHSTHPIDEFIDILQTYHIKQLVDIRTIPKSRHNPQFTQNNLLISLPRAAIKYIYLEALGGLRPSSKASLNSGWRNSSFRNYADYMQSPAFVEGIQELLRIAQKKPTAIMCAEAVPWRCHRSLVADALIIRQQKVIDIFNLTTSKQHTLTPFARVEGTTITYPSPNNQNHTKIKVND